MPASTAADARPPDSTVPVPPLGTLPPPGTVPSTTVDPVVLRQITDLRAELDRLTSELVEAESERVRLETRFRASQVRIDSARAHQAEVRQVLARRAVAAYKGNDIQLVSLILDAESLPQLQTRRELVEGVFASDAAVLGQWKDAQARLAEEEEALASLAAEQARAASTVKSRRDSVAARLQQLEDVIGRINPRAVGPAQLAPPAVAGFVFPVGQPHSIADDFGAYRAGPPVHSHGGNDISAPEGTPLFACVDGIVEIGSGGGGGNMLWISTPTGDFYFYAHLSAYADGVRTGTRVRAGQIVGYVGSTGNSTGPHLHFEIHPGGGASIDPHAILVAADRGATAALVGAVAVPPAPNPTATAPGAPATAPDTITPTALPELPNLPPPGPID